MAEALSDIRKRDANSAATWFRPQTPKGFGACGQAFIDRRELLRRLDALLTAAEAWARQDPTGLRGDVAAARSALLAAIEEVSKP